MEEAIKRYLDKRFSEIKQEIKDVEIRLSHRIDGVERKVDKGLEWHRRIYESIEMKHEALESRVRELEEASN